MAVLDEWSPPWLAREQKPAYRPPDSKIAHPSGQNGGVESPPAVGSRPYDGAAIALAAAHPSDYEQRRHRALTLVFEAIHPGALVRAAQSAP